MSMRDAEGPLMGDSFSATTCASDGGISHMLGHSQPDVENTFALLSPIGRTTFTDPAGNASAAPTDVLEQLRREAEAALRDPDYVSPHAMAVAVSATPAFTQASADPLQSMTRAGHGEDSLLELLEGPANLKDVADRLDSLDRHELFAVPHAPDVLRLFAGGLAPTRRQDVAAPLTRRDHHLVSMDSAYRLAQAQESGHGK